MTTATTATTTTRSEAEAIAGSVHADGYAIIEGVLTPEQCASLIEEVDRVETSQGIVEGTNDFEGLATRRIFNLISHSEDFRSLCVDDRVLAAVEAILGAECLLSGTTSMNIGPGETEQLLHADDGMVTLPRPHPATMVTTLWALSEFRSNNGATHLVPQSHLADRLPRREDDLAPIHAEMPAGSVLVMHGSTHHGGGHNTTADERRYGLSVQYVAGWCRQQQNLMLGTDPAVVATYPRRLQQLIGYTLYRNVMGHVDRQDPITLLGVEAEPNMVWDKMNNADTSAKGETQ